MKIEQGFRHIITRLWRFNSKFSLFILLCIMSLLINLSFLNLPSKSNPEQARSAYSFIDSIGINVHIDEIRNVYRNYDEIIKPKLIELGVPHIRNNHLLGSIDRQQNTIQKFQDLAKNGIKLDLIMDPRAVSAKRAVQVSQALDDSLVAVEGPNEWDIHPTFEYQGKNFPQGLRNYQADLYSAIKSDPDTAHLPVLAPSLTSLRGTGFGSITSCDIRNIHHYPGKMQPPSQRNKELVTRSMEVCDAKSVMVTEFGFHTAISRDGLSEEAAAKYLLRMYLEWFNQRVKRAYAYQLIDGYPDPGETDREFHYGLLRNDGSPKLSFISLKNTIALLKDTEAENSEAPAFKSLEYRLQGDTKDIHHTLLQKHNGKFYLILWQEVASFDFQKKKDLMVDERPLTLILNTEINSASLYRPLDSVKASAKYTNPQQLEIKVPDHPLIIEVEPFSETISETISSRFMTFSNL